MKKGNFWLASVYPASSRDHRIVRKHLQILLKKTQIVKKSCPIFQVQSYQAHSLYLYTVAELFYKNVLEAKLQTIQE